MRQYVKLIRFHNNGFKTTPYNSTSFPHVMPFINYEVTDLEKVNAVVSESDFINPIKDDENWKGCFVFLEKYNKDLLNKGALVMRQGHRKNVAYWEANDQTIWVRNTSHTGKDDCYVNQYKEILEHDGQPYDNFKYISYYSSYYWVKMKIELALQRIILGEQHFGYIPEWLSECYIMDYQVKQFKTSKLFILREQMSRLLSLR
ncbi:hypothetical protein OQE43_16770 [Bacillus velezensis]|uniref:hypothetical protein n=1 Tax=Bacillus velezensis TaxID=492670 RepID=UPI0009097872|nr:hypothetical protein [Bacillus velezensis]APH36097.1 hypothetical protein BHE96_11125 [Bacillus subtilis]MCX2885951.1 hypothetical protein [Bacillus velezensis]